MKTRVLLLVLSGAALLPALGAEVSIGLDIRLGKLPPPPPPEIVVIEQKAPPGPPPWAPAHGFRRKHAYYYYPGADVYYRPDDRVWFYVEGGNWRFGATLPSSIRVDFDRSVALTMDTDRPFRFHNDVKVRYPADYFVTKVKLKGNGPGTDGPGNSNGKGKGKGKGR